MPTPPGYASCSYELRHALMSRSAFLTFGIDITSTETNTVADNLRTAFGAPGSLFSCIDSSVTLVACHASVGTDGGADVVGINTVTMACTLNSGTLPPNSAVLVHKRSARGGRRGRGRMYIPWAASTAAQENGALFASDVTRVQAAIGVWRTQLAALEGPLVILHRPSAPGVTRPTAPGSPDVVTTTSVDTLVATQRRRLGR